MSTPDPATTPWVPLAGPKGADGATGPIGPVGATGAGGSVGYGITLPASPTDGQEFILVDSLTNPTYQWRFRYNAGNTTAYKWEFVGGAPIGINETDQKTRQLAAVGDPTVGTPGPSCTIPRPGWYYVTFTCDYFYVGGAPAAVPGVYLYHSGASSGVILTRSGAVGYTSQAGGVTVNVTAAGLLKAQYASDGTYSASWNTPRMTVTPIRVS